jgi:hypothetical protein
MFRGLKAAGFLCLFFVTLFAVPRSSAGQTRPDTLELQQPGNVFGVPVMNPNRQWFTNYIFWEAPPDSMGTFIHPPDTSGWHSAMSTNVRDSLSTPVTSGVHTGDIDRTLGFRALQNGRVGQAGELRIRYEVVSQEFLNRVMDVGSGYQPGDPIPAILISELNGDTLDLGINLHFGPGLIDSNGVFVVGAEDFEGFHIWRGIDPEGKDLVSIGGLSKQAAFDDAPVDLLYYSEIIPALRATGRYTFPFPVNGLGTELDITTIHPNGRLGPNEFVWFDLNAFNGFTYQFTVTTFDRGYNVKSFSQGLFKFDNCPVNQPDPFDPNDPWEPGDPYVCADELVPALTIVTPQDNLAEVYAVPNPYRSGTSQFTTPNYRNFPDNKVRFVNVPAECRLRIYTVAGDFVFEINNAARAGNLEWDTRNTAGQPVASGAYIFRCENPSGDGVYGRLIIIR